MKLGILDTIYITTVSTDKFLRRPGGEGYEVDFPFFVVSYREEWQLPGTFFGMKKYFFKPKLSNFEIAKMRTIKLRARIFIAISQQFS